MSCSTVFARPSDVELERDVVLEEIAMRDDDPEDTIGDVFLSAMFGDHPVGRPVIGSVESVSAMTRDQLHSFHVRRYIPERMVVAVAGNIEHDHVVELVRTYFGARLVTGPHSRSRTAAAPAGWRAGRSSPWCTATANRPI